MKLFLLIFLNLILINKAYSQNAYGKIIIEIEIGRKKKITKVDVDGDFPNADTAWKKRITKSLSTSNFVAKRAKRGKYTVSVAYVVTKDGSISDVKCISDPGYGMCQEAVRAVKKGPAWKPATQGGREVMPYRTSSNAPRH